MSEKEREQKQKPGKKTFRRKAKKSLAREATRRDGEQGEAPGGKPKKKVSTCLQISCENGKKGERSEEEEEEEQGEKEWMERRKERFLQGTDESRLPAFGKLVFPVRRAFTSRKRKVSFVRKEK
ncbi:hypothetical protein RUM44_010188 [Polyplax serrata]|uniref:Uncharacterized protein n=1 Tax=Polyplax serrata TaxID=468196 RepID=A0ABR1AUT5_POLSC